MFGLLEKIYRKGEIVAIMIMGQRIERAWKRFGNQYFLMILRKIL